MLAAEHERKLAGVEHRLDQALELIERRRHGLGDLRLAHRGDAIVEIGLAPQLLVEQLELVARRQDRLRARRGAARHS